MKSTHYNFLWLLLLLLVLLLLVNLVLKNIVILLLLGDIEYVIKEKKEKINAQVIDKNMHICIDEFRLGLSGL